MPYVARRRPRNIRRRRTRRTVAPRKAPVKKAVRAAATKTFNMRVNRALRTMNVIERKSKTITIPTQLPKGFGLQTTATGSSTTRGALFLNVFNQMPLVRGTTQEQFSGNEISDVKMRFSGMIVSNPYDASSNNSTMPFEVWAITYKVKPAFSNPTQGVPNDIKVYPGNVTGRITGQPFTTSYPWNRDGYTIKSVKKYLLRARPKDTNSDDQIENPQTSDYPAFKRISFDLPVAKTLKYNDGQNSPSNDYLSLGFYCINGSGTDPGDANQLRCTIYGAITISWVDA